VFRLPTCQRSDASGDGTPEGIMTTPFLTVIGAILYFGWLWHDRSAAHYKRGSLGRPVIRSNRTGEFHELQLRPVQRVTAGPFNFKNVSAPIAHALNQPDQGRCASTTFGPAVKSGCIAGTVDRDDMSNRRES